MRGLFALFAVCLFAGSALPAFAEKRVALVIGNSAYSNAPKLTNPVNDAESVGLLLKRAGFDVVEARRDLGVAEMRRAVRDFSDLTRNADMAVVFYAGHGIEVDGSNYLVPVDAKLERDLDVEDETVSLERVLKVLDQAKRLRLVILDACRDNPFARSMKRTIAKRAIGRGLASVEPASSDTLIAFAAKAGSTAADGDGVHSPFTAALLQHIATPGLDLRIAFGRVRDQVVQSTGSRQEPFVYGSLGGANVALVSRAGAIELVARPDLFETQMASDYAFAAKVGTKEAWDAFLAKYSTGFYADLARAQREKLIAALSVAPPASDRPVEQKKGPEPQKATKPSASAQQSRQERKKVKTAGVNVVSVSADWCAKHAPNGIDPAIYRAGMAYPSGRASWRGIARACGFRR